MDIDPKRLVEVLVVLTIVLFVFFTQDRASDLDDENTKKKIEVLNKQTLESLPKFTIDVADPELTTLDNQTNHQY